MRVLFDDVFRAPEPKLRLRRRRRFLRVVAEPQGDGDGLPRHEGRGRLGGEGEVRGRGFAGEGVGGPFTDGAGPRRVRGEKAGCGMCESLAESRGLRVRSRSDSVRAGSGLNDREASGFVEGGGEEAVALEVGPEGVGDQGFVFGAAFGAG